MDYRLMPEDPTWESTPPVLPDDKGRYSVPMPATYKIVNVTTIGKS